MGFFVRDVHNNITKLHAQQCVELSSSSSFTIYRGQGLPKADFDQLIKTQGGLLSFNNFLSASTKRAVSLNFVRRIVEISDFVGIVFAMNIDPSIESTSFANISEVSYFKREEEFLFSMHSVFRIGPMKEIDRNDRLWQVDLTLTSGNDSELHAITEQIRKEIYPEKKGWNRLGNLFIQLEQFNKAQELYDMLLEQKMTDHEKALTSHMLAIVKYRQGEHADAIDYYQKSIETMKNSFSPVDADLADSYTGIGNSSLDVDVPDEKTNTAHSHSRLQSKSDEEL
ncbi:unnamed protein product [Rotaria sp. Silwood1]|nr:unnamed protein product [Rotaria sp. Silwood1]